MLLRVCCNGGGVNGNFTPGTFHPAKNGVAHPMTVGRDRIQIKARPSVTHIDGEPAKGPVS